MQVPPTKETKQLILRAPTQDDVDAMFAMQSNAKAMQYTWHTDSRDTVAEHLASHSAEAQRQGFGAWTVVCKADGVIVGRGGLFVDEFDPGWGPEVGYFIHPDYWGRGFASELVGAALAYGFDDIGLEMICAFSHPDNHASHRVLFKHGFEYIRFLPGPNRNYYEVQRPA